MRLAALPAAVAISLIRGYQRGISPWLRVTCRFDPSCSTYALEAVRRHGLLRGFLYAARRLSRCHPFSRRAGYDPVP